MSIYFHGQKLYMYHREIAFYALANMPTFLYRDGMSRCLVTGAAGFIGSHLCETLLSKGYEVVGLDAFIPYYDRGVKESNLKQALQRSTFTFHEQDLRTAPLDSIVEGCDVIFHEAAMPGLMRSWQDFELYSSCNELGTLRLLEAARNQRIQQFIHVSTSSVYGMNATQSEDAVPSPVSPYGITKLAAEHLCRTFAKVFDVPITILRYFSVYGPRQRPDMGYHLLIDDMMNDEPFTLYGDGEQTRSNTFVGDGVSATISAFEKRAVAVGETFNIGGGEVVSLNQVVKKLEEIIGKQAKLQRRPPRPGDQRHTEAHIEKAKRLLGYTPQVRVMDGLQAQVEWQEGRRVIG